MIDDVEGETLPFTERNEQFAFLGHVMDYEKTAAFMQVRTTVKPEWFSDAYAGRLYSIYCQFYDTYQTTPKSTEDLFLHAGYKNLPKEDQLKVANAERACRQLAPKFRPESMMQMLTDWMRFRLLKAGMEKAERPFNLKDYSQASSILEDALKKMQLVSFGGPPPSNWSDYEALAKRRNVQHLDAMSTGLTLLDKKMNPEGRGGAMVKGEATLFLAATNGGKSACMSTIAAHNLMIGKNVLWVTLEGNSDALDEALWGCVLRKTRPDWKRMALYPTEQERQMLGMISAMGERRLRHMHVQEAGNTIERVEANIRQYINSFKAKNNGDSFDLIIVDYPQILTSEGRSNIKMESRDEIRYIYRRLFDLAAEENFHLVTAIQANRAGVKDFRKIHNKNAKHVPRLLTKEDIAESWGVANDAPMVITINRDDVDQKNNTMTFFIDKSRSGETGWAVACKTDFNHCCTHSDEMGATTYRGWDSLANRTNNIINNYKNQEIGSEELKDVQNEVEATAWT
jgi:replicative DNA helicase